MAAPVILLDQSIPDFFQWEAWQIAPGASNDPTAWSITGLPSGVTFDAVTGRISGAAIFPGLFQVRVVASNSDGPSDPAFFAVEIRRSAATPPSTALDVRIDLDTLAVTVVGGDAKLGALLKLASDRILQITFVRGGVVADLALTAMGFGFKADETQPGPLLSGTTWRKYGTGTSAFYRLYVQVANDALPFDGPADDSTPAADALTRSELCEGIAEITWAEINPFAVGPSSLAGKSLNFLATIERNLP